MDFSGTRVGEQLSVGLQQAKQRELTLETRRVHSRLAYSYVMGSITRIACKNFVTYNHVEFNPGP